MGAKGKLRRAERTAARASRGRCRGRPEGPFAREVKYRLDLKSRLPFEDLRTLFKNKNYNKKIGISSPRVCADAPLAPVHPFPQPPLPGCVELGAELNIHRESLGEAKSVPRVSWANSDGAHIVRKTAWLQPVPAPLPLRATIQLPGGEKKNKMVLEMREKD